MFCNKRLGVGTAYLPILYAHHCMYHRISIPAYTTEQQWWQSSVPINEMSLIFKNDARSLARLVTMWLYFNNLMSCQIGHLFFAFTVSIRWKLLTPTHCWSINTESMVCMYYRDVHTYVTRYNMKIVELCTAIR
jgi:hypothetical protein